MLTVTKEDAGKTIELQVNDVLQIQLTGTPTTGFWWHFLVLDEKYVEIIKKHTKEILLERGEGGPVLGTWQLRAKEVGTTTIQMAYYRAWDDAKKATDGFHIILRIKAKGFNA